jgi:hypothetical protein
MVNLTPDGLVFNVDDNALGIAIRNSLALAAKTSLATLNLSHVDLQAVHSKNNVRAVFAKFVEMKLLVTSECIFDRHYVEVALDAYRQKTGYLNKTHFDGLMFPDASGALAYKMRYAIAIRPALGLFLVALHSSNAITLPATFPWPSVREEQANAGYRKRREIGRLVASELLAFVRQLDTQSDVLPHPAFKAIGGDKKRREWFLSYATKLLLATGWHKPEDVNIADLLAIKNAERTCSAIAPTPLAYKALLSVLKLAFGDRVNVTVEQWSNALQSELARHARLGRQGPGASSEALVQLLRKGPRADCDLLEEVLHLEPLWGRVEHVRVQASLPGLGVDLQSKSKLWLQLEELYVEKTIRESYKAIQSAFGWWNVYLFYYLPYWFARNPTSKLTFPVSPSLLLKSVFVSRLLPSTEERPITFVEFMNAQSQKRGWNGNSHYGLLLQLQGFFEFLERYSDEIPDCNGFAQPLSPHDYPRTSRPKASKKEPVPRRFFGVYLDYHEALLAHHGVITNRILCGDLNSNDLKTVVSNGRVIDTFSTSNIVGFIPLLFTPTKTIPLQFIPNVLDLGWRTLRDGRVLQIPHPHGLTQNLVSLHTGLRHNHIQWLDREKFDSRVDEADVEFCLLYVNTDKQKREPWTPHVSMRVIELLRAQRNWSELVGEEGFRSLHYYNGNQRTKWPKIYPLFAYTTQGKPHHDQVYAGIWQETLCGLQGLMSSLSEYGRSRPLLRLLPPGHKSDDRELDRRLIEYGKQFGAGESCPLKVMSATTPHSARVAVVSQYITFLPTDLIGKHITGQKPGTVPYYVHLDRETIEADQVHQASRIRNATLRSAFEPVLKGSAASTTFIHADSVNSNLARSIRADLRAAIVSYGATSITFSEDPKRGVDILLDTNAADVAFNKTELCPYDNDCPPHIVKELRRRRRCSLCPAAVRTIDHLPAVIAKKRQVAEMVDELETLLSSDARTLNTKYTSEELNELEAERAYLCEDLGGWILNEEVLEVARHRIAAEQDSRKWIIPRPEILTRDLQRVSTRTSNMEYLLARLGECISFPSLESPQVRARFDLLRRELLARAGQLREAFASPIPVDPAAKCAGMLRAIIESTGKTVEQLADMLERDTHLTDLPETNLRLLANDG